MPRKKDDLCKLIENVLRNNFPNNTVDASLSGIRDNIHVLVVSRKFDDLTEHQKIELLWSCLGSLDEDQQERISLILPLSVQELLR